MNARKLLAALLTAGLLAVPATASAAGWKRVTTPDGASIDQVGLLRSADGALHVAWHHPSGPNSEDLLHTTISASGKIGATAPITTGWAGIQNAAVAAAPGGIRVIFGGIRTTATDEPNQELNTALSADGGSTWALQIGSIVPLGAQPYGSPVSAAALPDGTPLQAWAGTLGTWVHAGLDPAVANRDYQAPLGNYGYDAAVAASSSGQAQLAWYSNAAGHLGVYAQGVAVDGSPIGGAANMPGTSAMKVGMLARTPIVARPGGGFYVAYPTGYPSLNRVRLWRVGSSRTTLIAATPGNAVATLATTTSGRLWVAWTRSSGGRVRVLARASNPAATRFGAVVDAGAPTTAPISGYRLDASAAGDALDVLGAFSVGATDKAATYVRRVLPGLTLTASRSKLRRDRPQRVTFTVLDAGDAVRNAKVKVGARSVTTDAKGRAKLTLTAGGSSLTASATATGHTAAALRLRVVR